MHWQSKLHLRLLWSLFPSIKLRRQEAESTEDQMQSRRSDNMAAVVDIPVDALGIEPRLKKLQSYLIGNHHACSTIAICGPAGSGKTTLLKSLNNKLLSCEHDFQMVIFAPVSRDSSIERLQAVIAERLSLPWLERESRETKAVLIAMALENKRFLLLLDGLREPLNLDDIGIPNGKVLFTTRSRQVCSKMGAHEVFNVDPLDPQVAWQLFQRFAGERASCPQIIDLAQNLASECEGLPLGLMTVGRSMTSVMTKEEWIDSLETLKLLKQEHSTQGITEDSSALLSQFYFSYRSLRSQQLKDCLLFCSLFPKNHSMKKKDLIRYWMGEGLLEEYPSIDQAQRQGDKLISKLKALGMLEDGDHPDSEVVMHDLFCDLALLIKKNEYLVHAGMELFKVPEVISFKETEKVSLMNNNIQVLDQLPTLPHLTTLILRRNICLRRVEDRNLFKASSSLRLLDLSYTRIRSIPSEVGSLVFLRHLDLSFTKIKVLQREIGNLVNLVQLLLEGTSSLATVPVDVISKLSKVRVLNMYGSFGDWEVKDCQGSCQGSNQEEKKSADLQFSGIGIEDLECLEQLTDLGITICNTPSFERFMLSRRLTRATRWLLVKNCEDLESVHLSSLSFENLREVMIFDCSILKELMIGGNSGDDSKGGKDSRLLHLEVLRLKALYQAQIIFHTGKVTRNCLPMLRELDISFCHELKNVSWVLQLGCLERINLNNCRKIEHVVDQGSGKLPRLRTLTLRNLPQLKGICQSPMSCPSLVSVKVLQCPQLRSLPWRDSSIGTGTILVLIQGEKEWWNALEWKDKQASFWYFQATEELC